MKTDALFHELFVLEPALLFTLLGRPQQVPYAFKSITVKRVEKRLDGYFHPLTSEPNAQSPLTFLEVQGYNDPHIYWRLLRGIATHLEGIQGDPPILAVVLFLQDRYRPPRCQISLAPPSELVVLTLEACLKVLPQQAGAINVLRPMLVEDVPELIQALPDWKRSIDSTAAPDSVRERLLELLEYMILQRFPFMTTQEIQHMLNLTPLEETVAVKELMAIAERRGEALGEKRGEARGEKRGEARGVLIGKIRLCQELLGLTPSSQEELRRLPLHALERRAEELKNRLGG